MDGLLIIDKPPDVTSHDVVAQARKILRERRIGHTGTLDPFATGVLVLLVGRATRLAQFVSDTDKEYEAVIRLGFATDSGDLTGVPLEQSDTRLDFSESELEAALAGLRGNILQVPPMYSAKKKEGRKLYEFARRGIEIDRPPIPVCISELQAIKTDGSVLKDNLDGTKDVRVRVVCSPGTYIRTLAEDLGKRLGSAAHVAELRRTRIGEFSLDSAITLEMLKRSVEEEAVGTVLRPPAAALSRMPFVHLTVEDARRAQNGTALAVPAADWSDEATVGLLDERGNLIGVGYFDARKRLLQPGVVLSLEK